MKTLEAANKAVDSEPGNEEYQRLKEITSRKIAMQ